MPARISPRVQSFPWQEEGPSCTWAKPRAAIVFIAPSGRRKNRFPCQKEALASTNMALGPSRPFRAEANARFSRSSVQVRNRENITRRTHQDSPTIGLQPPPERWKKVAWRPSSRSLSLSLSLSFPSIIASLCVMSCCCAECLVIVITTSVLSRFQNCCLFFLDMQ